MNHFSSIDFKFGSHLMLGCAWWSLYNEKFRDA